MNHNQHNPSSKTLAELDLADVPFPSNFTPRYTAMNESGCWYCFDVRPAFENGDWIARNGNLYEIGIDDTDDLIHTPEFARNIPTQDSLFSIVL